MLRLPLESAKPCPRIRIKSNTFFQKARIQLPDQLITSTRVASKMRRSIITAALTAIAYVVAMPSGSRIDVSPPNLLGSNITSDNTTKSLAKRLHICARDPDLALVCTGKSSEVNPTCDFTPWCKWYMSPFRDLTLCAKDEEVYLTVECCMEGLKNSCGGKEPSLTGVYLHDPP